MLESVHLIRISWSLLACAELAMLFYLFIYFLFRTCICKSTEYLCTEQVIETVSTMA